MQLQDRDWPPSQIWSINSGPGLEQKVKRPCRDCPGGLRKSEKMLWEEEGATLCGGPRRAAASSNEKKKRKRTQ